MTVSSTVRKKTFLGNDLTTAFDFSFKVFADTDLQVVLTDSDGNDSTLTLDSHYSVALNGDQEASPGGSITYPISGDPLATGEKLTVTGVLAASQETNLANAGGFFPETLETRLDYLTILIQEQAEQLARAVLASVSDDDPVLSLGTAAQRAGKFTSFDDNGNIEFAQTLPEGSLTPSSVESNLTRTGIGRVFYPLSDDESVAGLTDADISHEFIYGDVRRYGVTGDGATDDTTAMQAAIDAGVDEIFVTEGLTVIVSSNLVWRSNLSLRIGRGSSIKLADGSVTDIRLIDARGGLTDIGFYGPGKLDCNKAGQAVGNKSHGLAITATNFVVSGLEVCNTQVDAGSLGDGIILEPTIPDNGTQCVNGLIFGCYIHDTDRQGLTLESGLGVRVIGNRFEDVTNGGIAIEPAGFTIGDVDDVLIADNSFTRCDMGIKAVSAEPVTLMQNIRCHDNNIDTVETGYMLRASSDVHIDGGVLSDIGTVGVRIYSDGVTVTEKTSVKNLKIKGTMTHGVWAEVVGGGTHTDIVVEGCQVEGSTTRAFDFTSVTGLRVRGNEAVLSIGEGFAFTLCIDAELDGNTDKETGGLAATLAYRIGSNTNVTVGHNTALGVLTGYRFQSNAKIVFRGGDNLDEATTPLSDLGGNTDWYGVFSGSFTMDAVVQKNVANGFVNANSFIHLTPTNANAGTLQAGTDALYHAKSALVDETSFRVATAAGGLAAGTETFDYTIVNQNF